MIGPLSRLGAAATLGQHCPHMTQRPGNRNRRRIDDAQNWSNYRTWCFLNNSQKNAIIANCSPIAKIVIAPASCVKLRGWLTL